jgi:hypothetical protein
MDARALSHTDDNSLVIIFQCARGAISEKAECPACRKSAAETHLRVDPAIEEIVAAWKAARYTHTSIIYYTHSHSLLPL